MIIETKGDTVRLSGSLHKNQWITIRAAANLLLHNHPQGIIIDCENIESISEDGAKTFLEAMRDIETAKSRIVVANLPDNILAVCKTVPGVRSQLPIAKSVEEARASLRIASHSLDSTQKSANSNFEKTVLPTVIMVPLIDGIDLTYGGALAGRLAHLNKAEVRLIYFIQVPRTLPLNAPLIDEEQRAQAALEKAMRFARENAAKTTHHVERVREPHEGILAAINAQKAELVVIGAVNEPIGAEGHDTFHELVDTLLHRAPCEVIIGRLKPND